MSLFGIDGWLDSWEGIKIMIIVLLTVIVLLIIAVMGINTGSINLNLGLK